MLSVAAWRAFATELRIGSTATHVPSLTRLVNAATHVSVVCIS